jgi:hypothetical protein
MWTLRAVFVWECGTMSARRSGSPPDLAARENGQAEGDLYSAIEGLVDEGNIELG